MPNRLSGRSPSSTLPLTYMPPYWLFFPPCFRFPTWFIMPLWQSTPKPPRMCNHCTYLPRPSSARTSHDSPWRPAPVRAYRIDSDSTRTFILFRLNVLQYKSRTKPQYPTHPPHTVSRLRPPKHNYIPGTALTCVTSTFSILLLVHPSGPPCRLFRSFRHGFWRPPNSVPRCAK